MTCGAARARVLLLGESVDEREMYGEALRMAGFCTLQACTARAAVRLVSELAPSVVVISDGRLDSGFGLSLLLELRNGGAEQPGPPVLLVTSHARPAEIQAVIKAGCDRVLIKPCPPETLIEVLGQVVTGEPLNR